MNELIEINKKIAMHLKSACEEISKANNHTAQTRDPFMRYMNARYFGLRETIENIIARLGETSETIERAKQIQEKRQG